MARYIALLRGINVGGKNKIAMPELKTVFEKQGFHNVLTYINCGNIIFDSSLSERDVQIACETEIKAGFGLDIPVRITTAAELQEVLNNAPDWWGDSDTSVHHDAIFVIPPMTVKEICSQIGESIPEYESVICFERVILWSAAACYLFTGALVENRREQSNQKYCYNP